MALGWVISTIYADIMHYIHMMGGVKILILHIKVGRLIMSRQCLLHTIPPISMMVYDLYDGLVIHFIGYDEHGGRHLHHLIMHHLPLT